MNDHNETIPNTCIEFSFPGEVASIREARRFITHKAGVLPFSQEQLDDIALAVSEAFTNLVQFAPGRRIHGSCVTREHQLEIRFQVDHALSRYLQVRRFPSGLARSGRGIPLLHLLIPTVELHECHDGTWELLMIKPVDNEEGTCNGF